MTRSIALVNGTVYQVSSEDADTVVGSLLENGTAARVVTITVDGHRKLLNTQHVLTIEDDKPATDG